MKRWLEIAMVFAVAGCAGSSEKQSAEPVVPVAEDQVEAQEAERETSIDAHVLYLLMVAEVAVQRSQYGVALDAYLQAAMQVDDPRVAERAAKIGLFLKDARRTDEAVGLWLENDPDNLTARKIATLSALRSANKAEAVDHLNASMRLDPAGFESTLLEMGKLMEKDGKDEFIFDVLEELSVQHPDQAVIFFVQSLLAAKQQKIDVAQKKINAALNIQPEWTKALIFQAQLAARAGDLETARESLEKAL
jgi:tetratricopeptide (TPR) repeat protein